LDEQTFGRVKEDLLLKPGALYNQGLAELFLRANSDLIDGGSLPTDRIGYELDERDSTLALTYDFRPCTAR